MGFIDWHKNKKDHYEDVLDYAKARREEEIIREKDKKIRKRISDLIGNPGYFGMASSDVMRSLIREYSALKSLYAECTNSQNPHENRLDSDLLWKDLWTVSIDDILAKQGGNLQQKIALFQAIQEKVFRLNAPLTVSQYLTAKKENKKYRRYLENCFFIREHALMLFFRYVSQSGATNQKKVRELIRGLGKCRLLLAYYLYLSSNPGEDWIMGMEEDVRYVADAERMITHWMYNTVDYRKLRNPLFMQQSPGMKELEKAARVLLFNLKKKVKQKGNEGGMKMIEELYLALEDQILSFERIESILPGKAKEQICMGNLPSFPNPGLQVLAENEQLFYLDHAILYQGKECDDEIKFSAYKGTAYFTDCRIVFRCDSMMDIQYEHIERVVEYDLLPEILEVVCNGKSNFFQLPDVESAYKLLKLIKNRHRGERREEMEIPFTYAELVDKADLGACIFAFEHVISGDLPAELKDRIEQLIPKLKCLQKTVIQYPDKKASIYQFLHYYVPEAVRVSVQYRHYQFVALEQAALRNVYKKVMDALGALDLAVTQKIADIYQFAAMDTIAQAEALREILGQDGFVDSMHTTE